MNHFLNSATPTYFSIVLCVGFVVFGLCLLSLGSRINDLHELFKFNSKRISDANQDAMRDYTTTSRRVRELTEKVDSLWDWSDKVTRIVNENQEITDDEIADLSYPWWKRFLVERLDL